MDRRHSMSGRLILTIMLIGCLVTAVFLYFGIRDASQYKGLVTDQMEVEFVNYAHLIQKTDRLKVAESNSAQFFVNTQKPWKFIIHQKTLLVTAPPIESEPTNQPVTPEIEASAKKVIQDFLLVWLEDKFHTKKDLLVEVHW